MPAPDPHAETAAPRYDLLVVGGGVNGTGIARDAAGRGLSVVLCEQDDLAGHTSSASTKLIHGGLRYLEHYEFALVRKALQERAVLLRLAPHIARPLRFILPHEPHLRPAWLIRAGLVLYDHLAPRAGLPATATLDLTRDPAGLPLKPEFQRGFAYFDGWIDDARLVVLNALDAAERGARILTRTRLAGIERTGSEFTALLEAASGVRHSVRVRALANAAGPWAAGVAALCSSGVAHHGLTLVKGSHIVVPRLFAHTAAYIFQNVDGRIVFAIPYEDDFTLIGTTDVPYVGDPRQVAADPAEVAYLCEVASRYFARSVVPAEVVYAYAGVRPLLAGEAADGNAASLSRDYALELEPGMPPWLNVFGGKLTTYRRLAEEALNALAPLLGSAAGPWTASAPLPGGELGAGGVGALAAELSRDYPLLPVPLLKRYATAYGTRTRQLLGGVRDAGRLGEPIVADLYRCELEYLIEHEWAMTAEDVLWRRSKLGLRVNAGAAARLGQWMSARLQGELRRRPA